MPAFVATGMLLEAVRSAALGSTTAAWTQAGIEALVVVALAWYAARVLRTAMPAAGGAPNATAASDPVAGRRRR